MSSCIATSRLVHNGGYIRKLLQLSSSPEILIFGRLYLVNKVLLNLYRFDGILATLQYLKCRNLALWVSFLRFVNGYIDFMAAEVEAIKDSFEEVKQIFQRGKNCTANQAKLVSLVSLHR